MVGTDNNRTTPQGRQVFPPQRETCLRVWLISRSGFWISVGAVGLAMTAVLLVLYNGYIAIPDEGVYSAQAKALALGGWETDRPSPDTIFGPEYVHLDLDPIGPSKLTDDGRIPYGRHPLYSIVLSGAYRIGGKPGLIAFSLVGGIFAAAFIGLACRKFAPQYGIPGLALAGLSSPLFFNSLIVSAHSWAVAFSAGIILSVLTLVDRPAVTGYLSLSGLAIILPMFRSEGVVVLGAFSLALGALSITGFRRQSTVHSRLLIGSLIVGISGMIGWILDIRWSRSILGVVGGKYTNISQAILGKHTSVIKGAWIALGQPWYDVADAQTTVVLIAVLVPLSAILWRICTSHLSIPFALMFAAGLLGITALVISSSLVTGMIAAWPLLVFSVVWIHREDLKSLKVKILMISAVVGIGGLTVTIYGDGGSTQWGGRFYHLLLPLIIPLTVIGIANALDRLANNMPNLLRPMIGIIVVIAITHGVLGVKANYRLRREVRIFVTEISDSIRRAQEETLNGVSSRNDYRKLLVLYNPVPATGAARTFWEMDVSLNLLTVSVQMLRPLLESVDFAAHQVLLITDAPPAVVNMSVETVRRDPSRTIKERVAPETAPVRIFMIS